MARALLPLLACCGLVAGCGKEAPRPAARPDAAPAAKAAPAARAAPLPAGWVAATDGGVPRHRFFRDAGAALAQVLESRPRVIGFGEYHQRIGGAPVPSAIKRFTEQLLPVLAPQTSDLVVETWVTDGACGATEKKVVQSVKKTTARPKETENEIVTLALRARAARVQPHALKVSCKDYKRILGGTNVDYVRLLEFIGHQLRDTAAAAMAQRARPDAKPGAKPGPAPDGGVAGGRRLVVLYGGALHNDLYPAAGLESWSYAADLAKQGRYVEVDLYVPEYVTGDERLAKEPWYPLLRRTGPDRVVLIERGEGSYILLFPTTPAPASAPASAPTAR